MSKLLSLKKWLTVESAANHLSTILNETVTVDDMYQFALDKHLTLSVRLLDYTPALMGRVVPKEQAKVRINICIDDDPSQFFILLNDYMPEELRVLVRFILQGAYEPDQAQEAEELLTKAINEYFPQTKDKSISKTMFFIGNELVDDNIAEWDSPLKVKTIYDIWDLPLIGREKLSIEPAYLKQTSVPDIILTEPNFVWLVSEDGKEWANIHDQLEAYGDKTICYELTENDYSDKYYPASRLPDHVQLIIRTSELQRFINSRSEPETEKPLTQREETTYLNIIGGLLDQLTNSKARNQSSVIATLIQEYGKLDGISQSNLDKKFAAANQSLKANI